MVAIDHSTWYSPRVGQHITLARWGHWGRPVLVFPTAGGDAWEIEHAGLIGALGGLIEGGRIKVYSVDSVAGRAWLGRADPLHSSWLQNAFDAMVADEVVPAIRADCRADDIGIVAAGASIGAFNAVASLCRHPDLFVAAVGMSGTYDLRPWLDGAWSDDFYFASPMEFLPNLGDGHQLHVLQHRFVVLTTGQGPWEDPGETWRMAHVLGMKGIPNRVDLWGPEWEHDWPTWHAMLPQYLAELA
jgi:esterase/lipase superfamily enzyme